MLRSDKGGQGSVGKTAVLATYTAAATEHSNRFSGMIYLLHMIGGTKRQQRNDERGNTAAAAARKAKRRTRARPEAWVIANNPETKKHLIRSRRKRVGTAVDTTVGGQSRRDEWARTTPRRIGKGCRRHGELVKFDRYLCKPGVHRIFLVSTTLLHDSLSLFRARRGLGSLASTVLSLRLASFHRPVG